MIHCKRIIRMPRQNFLEILNCGIVIEIVVVLESGLIQRIGRTKCTRRRRVSGHRNPDNKQQDNGS